MYVEMYYVGTYFKITLLYFPQYDRYLNCLFVTFTLSDKMWKGHKMNNHFQNSYVEDIHFYSEHRYKNYGAHKKD